MSTLCSPLSARLRRLAAAGGCLLATAALAQDGALPFVVSRTPPTVISATASQTTLQFGPSRLTFPSGWTFQPAGGMSRGTGPGGAQAAVSVLRSTTKEGQTQPSADEIQIARRSIATTAQEACTVPDAPSVDVLVQSDSTLVLGTGCEGVLPSGGQAYYVQYEIYSLGRFVQLSASGPGTAAAARALFDAVARSHE